MDAMPMPLPSALPRAKPARPRQNNVIQRLQASCAEAAVEVETKKRKLQEVLAAQRKLRQRLAEFERGSTSMSHGGVEASDVTHFDFPSDDAEDVVHEVLGEVVLSEEHEELCEEALFYTVPNVCTFVKKCYEIVNSRKTDSIVSWTADGTSFVVHDPQRCASEILPRYFKHANLMSWVRQLNKYGFRREVARDRTSHLGGQFDCGSLSDGTDCSGVPTLHFKHPLFRRGELPPLAGICVQKPGQ